MSTEQDAYHFDVEAFFPLRLFDRITLVSAALVVAVCLAACNEPPAVNPWGGAHFPGGSSSGSGGGGSSGGGGGGGGGGGW